MNNHRILVVDDHPTNLKLVRSVLEAGGFAVAAAADADEALHIIARGPPDLILMDIGLPGMDGLALTRRLKTQELTRGIVIIALTAFAMKGDDQRTLEAGCDGYISKPINTRTLCSQVAAALEQKINQL
jgi:CheY-like chemotaxis protein